MSASLVGSEMCIRDSACAPAHRRPAARPREPPARAARCQRGPPPSSRGPWQRGLRARAGPGRLRRSGRRAGSSVLGLGREGRRRPRRWRNGMHALRLGHARHGAVAGRRDPNTACARRRKGAALRASSRTCTLGSRTKSGEDRRGGEGGTRGHREREGPLREARLQLAHPVH
eukprot:8835339-Alexandrium_andersonii.AAC.1